MKTQTPNYSPTLPLGRLLTLRFSLLFTISFSLFTGFAPAKAQNLDSLYTVWQDETQPDSIQTTAFIDYIWDGFLYSDPDTAITLTDEMIAFGKKAEYPRAQATGLSIKGTSYYLKSDLHKALDYYTQSLKIYEQLGDQIRIASLLRSIGFTFDDQSDYSKALDYYTQSLKVYEQLGDQKGMAFLLNNIGLVYSRQNDYLKALHYYTQSLKIAEQLGDQEGISRVFNNIGIIYRVQGDKLKALEYYTQSLKIIEEMGDLYPMAKTLNNIGLVYSEEGDYTKALEYYTRSRKIHEKLGDQIGTAISLNNTGLVYSEQADYPKALEYYTQSIKIFEQLENLDGKANTLNNIGRDYNRQGDYPKALNYCQKGYDLARSIGVLVPQSDACECLYDAYKAMGNGDKALEYHEQMLVLDDSLQAEETAKKLQQMEFAKQVYQDSVATAEKERLVAEAHKEEVRKQNQTRNIAFAIGGLVLLLAGGLYSRLRYVRKSRAIIESERDRSDNLLLNILPEEIAQELKEKGRADARDFDMVSILFTDFKDFTEQNAKLSATDLVNEINHCFEAFDNIIEKYNIEKIKTIGDAYMAAGGLPVPSDDSVKNTVLAALEMQAFISQRKTEVDAAGLPAFEMRVGIHTGPVVAGIVGVKKFQYDIWGDTVNTASRMESSGEVGKVNISQATYELLKDTSTSLGAAHQFTFESRGKIEAKGKGEMEMWFVALS